MPDLTPVLLPQYRQHRLAGLDLGGDFVYPDYDGRSVLNLPASVCRFLDVPPISATAPLAPELTAPLGQGDFRRVVIILMDALALHRLQRWMADGTAPVWSHLAGLEAPTPDAPPAGASPSNGGSGPAARSVFAALTSVLPSTTSAALTSLWTGRSPAEHGIAGYELWLKEYGVVANTLKHAPASFQGDAGSLARAGFTPERFLPLPTLGPHLSAHGVQTYAFQHVSIARSSLTQMLFREAAMQAFYSAADLWVNARQLIERRPAERQYIWVYWGEVDTFGHRYGPDDERTAAEFSSFSQAFERLFLDRLTPAVRQDTLLILTADHGQVSTTPDPHYQLRSHPNLERRLHLLPTGEHRWMYLYARPGQTEAVREYIERAWPGGFSFLDPAYAVAAGLYGPGAPHPRLLDRLGDLIAAARGNSYLWWSQQEDQLLGRHGGLHPDEMLVPFVAARLA